MSASIEIVKKISNGKIVIIFLDKGDRYLSTDLFKQKFNKGYFVITLSRVIKKEEHMSAFVYIIVTTFCIALLAFIGIFTLFLRDKILNRILLILVGLSAGVLMGGAFLHLIPESIERNTNNTLEHGHAIDSTFIFILVGFILFFIIEKFLYWRHCHNRKCDVHTFSYMNLVGDSIHNFIDGLIIATSFTTSIELGVTAFIAVAAHELPQEIGDFGVLVYGGFEKKKALMMNFVVALTVIIGGIVGYFISENIGYATMFLLPFAAGGFIYIAATDLVPEIKKQINFRISLLTLVVFILGLLVMFLLKIMFSH